jgi:hypothetical protein
LATVGFDKPLISTFHPGFPSPLGRERPQEKKIRLAEDVMAFSHSFTPAYPVHDIPGCRAAAIGIV